ncbi:TPA: helix-turn-helix domain-containing protein [Escherichia coli]|nr:helix-turn-helix domain-containing protein [Escherichia coli]
MKDLTTTEISNLNHFEKESFALNIANLVGAARTFHLINGDRSKELGVEVIEFVHEYALSATYPLHNHIINKQPNKIRTQRETCGLTTAELARLLNIDEEIILQWECGKGEPLASQVIPLANVLGCDPMWLLTGAYKQNQEDA